MKVVLCTSPNREASAHIAKTLLEGEFAACITAVPQAYSWYRWQGRLEESAEELLLIKLPDEHVTAAFEKVRMIHPYENPEWVVLSPTDASPMYLQWVNAVGKTP